MTLVLNAKERDILSAAIRLYHSIKLEQREAEFKKLADHGQYELDQKFKETSKLIEENRADNVLMVTLARKIESLLPELPQTEITVSP